MYENKIEEVKKKLTLTERNLRDSTKRLGTTWNKWMDTTESEIKIHYRVELDLALQDVSSAQQLVDHYITKLASSSISTTTYNFRG